MNNALKCQQLFAFDSILFKDIFSRFEYPWQLLPHLGDLIHTVIESGLDGYELLYGGVLVGKGARIAPSARIEAPAIIGRGCEIRHCAYLRGSVLLGDGCVVGNSSEVKNSVMMDGAQAPHFNYVGDSILGMRAHLGAGAVCSNLRSDGKRVSIRTQNGTIETGMRKLGAILADGVEIGCGAVLCPGTVISKSTFVYPLTVARGFYPHESIVKDTARVTAKIPSAE